MSANISSRIVRRLRRLVGGSSLPSRYMAENPAYAKYSIGRFTYGEPTVLDYGDATLKVGSFCSISDGVKVLLGGNHRADWLTTYPFPELWPEAQGMPGHPATKGDVIIGHDVWIGLDALILSGVHVGDGAIIGARSVVTKSVAPYAIVAGNPARQIRKRFPEEVIARLLEIQWWQWPSEKISAALPHLLSGDFARFSAFASQAAA